LVVIVHLDGFLIWKKGFADEGMICDLVSGRRRPALGTLKALCDAIRLGTAEIVVFSTRAATTDGRSESRLDGV
jgi:hypothetical protein